MSETFQKIILENWRQYKKAEIDFHPRVTVITGPNGTGKSTILSMLSRHFGFNRNYLATPKKRKGKSGLSYSAGFFSSVFDKLLSVGSEPQARKVGSISYSNSAQSEILIPAINSLQYGPQVQNEQSVNGLHIDSHSQPSIYRGIGQLQTAPIQKETIFNQIHGELRHFYNNGNSSKGTLFFIKEALLSMNMFGYGNPDRDGNPELLDIFHGFEDKLKITLPKSLGFEKIHIRTPEVVLVTKSGEFVIDAASGGIIKIIEITWQIYLFSLKTSRFVVTMDEPENHLHPSMQRTILRDLQQAFPEVQFIIVSHSPFVVSSVEDSYVYVLNYETLDEIYEEHMDDDQSVRGMRGDRVVSEKLDTVNRAASATEILKEVLGVPTTIPDWAEKRTMEIIRSYRNKEVTDGLMDELAAHLEKEGLASKLPTALEALTSKSK